MAHGCTKGSQKSAARCLIARACAPRETARESVLEPYNAKDEKQRERCIVGIPGSAVVILLRARPREREREREKSRRITECARALMRVIHILSFFGISFFSRSSFFLVCAIVLVEWSSYFISG
jgi:hypothetical protein